MFGFLAWTKKKYIYHGGEISGLKFKKKKKHFCFTGFEMDASVNSSFAVDELNQKHACSPASVGDVSLLDLSSCLG